MRRAISCTLALLISATVLTAVPASSLAVGGSAPCTTNPCPPQAMVTVGLSFSGPDNYIVVPRLPVRAVKQNRLVRQDFLSLAGIANNLCDAVKIMSEEEGVYSYTGFTAQLARFNTMRRPLNNLLQRYDLGFAPDITDFSNAEVLDLRYAAKVTQGVEVEIQPPSITSCTFSLV